MKIQSGIARWIKWKNDTLPEGMYYIVNNKKETLEVIRLGIPCHVFISVSMVMFMVDGDPIATGLFKIHI